MEYTGSPKGGHQADQAAAIRTAIRRRLWTADRRRRHNLETHADCLLCDQEPETCDRILVSCSFTRQIWYSILVAINLPAQAPVGDLSLLSWTQLRNITPQGKKAGMDSLLALTSWEVWKERNKWVFRDGASTMQDLLSKIRAEADLWILAGNAALESLRTP